MPEDLKPSLGARLSRGLLQDFAEDAAVMWPKGLYASGRAL